MAMPETLAGELERIQRERNEAWRELAVRIERAQASLNRAACEEKARLDPASGAAALEVGGGVALFVGVGSPLTQALCMGLDRPLAEDELDAIEAHLGRGGGPVQYELCSMAAPELFAALGRRGYVATEFQLVWQRPLGAEPIEARIPAGLEEVRRMRPDEAAACQRVMMAGFMETQPERVSDAALAVMPPLPPGDRQQLWGALRGGQIIGAGMLHADEETATLAGTAVLPGHRGLGAQGALIRARLAEAQRRGCTLAVSSTAPGSQSQRNMERHGFRVAFPKVVLAKA